MISNSIIKSRLAADIKSALAIIVNLVVEFNAYNFYLILITSNIVVVLMLLSPNTTLNTPLVNHILKLIKTIGIVISAFKITYNNISNLMLVQKLFCQLHIPGIVKIINILNEFFNNSAIQQGIMLPDMPAPADNRRQIQYRLRIVNPSDILRCALPPIRANR